MPIKDKDKKNAYFRKYYKNHPELKEYHRKKAMEYYKRNKEKKKHED
jgi:hypothetical protein